MVDAVETFCNVRIQYIFRLMHDLFEYVLNGIMAPPAGAEAVTIRFKPGFPFRFQGLLDQRLCRRSCMTGIPSGRRSVFPGFGIYTRRTGCGAGISLSCLANWILSSGLMRAILSMPGVFFPALSCATRRTAKSRAGHDAVRSRCSLCTFRLSFRRVAW